MSILDNAKEVAKAVQQIQNLELYQRVLALHSDIIELVEENKRLRDENEDLRRKKDIGRRLRLDQHDHVLLLVQRKRRKRGRPLLHRLLGHRSKTGQANSVPKQR